MTTKLEQEFDKEFVLERTCRCCGNSPCDRSTTGCPWTEVRMIFDRDGNLADMPERIKAWIDANFISKSELQALLEQARREGIEEVAEELCAYIWEHRTAYDRTTDIIFAKFTKAGLNKLLNN